MDTSVKIVGGIDPGLNGGIAILIANHPVVYDIPTIEIEINRKKKRTIDVKKMCEVLAQFKDQKVAIGLESVSARPGESVVASFNFGKGFGYCEALSVAFNFEVLKISPAKWKKAYPELVASDKIEEIRDEIKALRAQSKSLTRAADKMDAKKQISSLARKLKYHAKDAARELAKQMFPEIADSFKLKKHDGRAEACLIAHFLKDHYDELV